MLALTDLKDTPPTQVSEDFKSYLRTSFNQTELAGQGFGTFNSFRTMTDIGRLNVVLAATLVGFMKPQIPEILLYGLPIVMTEEKTFKNAIKIQEQRLMDQTDELAPHRISRQAIEWSVSKTRRFTTAAFMTTDFKATQEGAEEVEQHMQNMAGMAIRTLAHECYYHCMMGGNRRLNEERPTAWPTRAAYEAMIHREIEEFACVNKYRLGPEKLFQARRQMLKDRYGITPNVVFMNVSKLSVNMSTGNPNYSDYSHTGERTAKRVQSSPVDSIPIGGMSVYNVPPSRHDGYPDVPNTSLAVTGRFAQFRRFPQQGPGDPYQVGLMNTNTGAYEYITFTEFFVACGRFKRDPTLVGGNPTNRWIFDLKALVDSGVVDDDFTEDTTVPRRECTCAAGGDLDDVNAGTPLDVASPLTPKEWIKVQEEQQARGILADRQSRVARYHIDQANPTAYRAEGAAATPTEVAAFQRGRRLRPEFTVSATIDDWERSGLVSGLLARPYDSYMMDHALMMEGGAKTGFTAMSQNAFHMGTDVGNNSEHIVMSMWAGAHVNDWRKVQVLQNVAYAGIVAGGSCALLNKTQGDVLRNRDFQVEGPESSCMYAIAFPTKVTDRDNPGNPRVDAFRGMRDYIHLQAPPDFEGGRNGRAEDFPGAAFYRQHYGFDHVGDQAATSETNSFARYCLMESYNILVGGHEQHYPGRTHHGPNEGTGCEVVRRNGFSCNPQPV